MDSQDALADFLEPSQLSEPSTPQPALHSVHEMNGATPPPSTQLSANNRAKTRTPTPAVSHMSTPPPTIDASQAERRPVSTYAAIMSTEQLAVASVEELRTKVTELQAAMQEAKMSAAHYKLQYKMLAQESAASMDRMKVEARMAQHENEVIHNAEQAKAAATPVQPPPLPEGVIPVHKDLYQRMSLEIRQLHDANRQWDREYSQQEKLINRQEGEIATLSDKVTLMRERIRENREHLNKVRNRGSITSKVDTTPRSTYGTPHRSHGLEALLQASEMTNPELRHKKGHSRNAHSISSIPTTPHRKHKPAAAPMYQTPSGRQPPLKIPSTAPMPRTSAMRTPGDVYGNPVLPVPARRGPASEGTVSASDHEDGNDSEAETDILEPDDPVNESQASRAASQMLRSSQEQAAKRDSFKGNGMLSGQGSGSQGGMKQTKLFGAVRKANVERVVAGADMPPAKRQRTGEANATQASPQHARVGLGISGVRE